MHKRGVDGFRVLRSEEKEKYQTIMLQITLDMYQTLAAAVVVLALGRFLRGRVRLLERFCIPAPVIGGVLFAIFTCVCYGTGIAEFAFDDVVYMGEINDIGGISLSLFLGMAMITLKLWQLADLAGPLVVLLAGQTVFILLYVVLVVFNVMGRDYDAAVLVSGTCGFGMGATPNAMANMQVVCEKYAPSIKAYLIVPLVGSLFADFLNSLAITLFINLI